MAIIDRPQANSSNFESKRNEIEGSLSALAARIGALEDYLRNFIKEPTQPLPEVEKIAFDVSNQSQLIGWMNVTQNRIQCIIRQIDALVDRFDF